MDMFVFKLFSKFTTCAILVLSLLCCFSCTSTEAYDACDPNGNITIKWDVTTWTADGYIAVVTIYNFQKYRQIQAPGWALEWTWAGEEVIQNVTGGQTTEQGNCSKFGGNIPHSCRKSVRIVDLPPGTPYNQRIENCCKGGVLSPWGQDRKSAVSSFQLSVGQAGNTNKTIRVPKNFSLTPPGKGYSCGPTKIVRPTMFISKDGRTVTRAMITWNVTCTYSQFLATPNSSYSSGCQHNTPHPESPLQREPQNNTHPESPSPGESQNNTHPGSPLLEELQPPPVSMAVRITPLILGLFIHNLLTSLSI